MKRFCILLFAVHYMLLVQLGSAQTPRSAESS